MKYPVFVSGGIMRYVNQYLYDKPGILLPRKGSLSGIQYYDKPFWTADTLFYTEANEELQANFKRETGETPLACRKGK